MHTSTKRPGRICNRVVLQVQTNLAGDLVERDFIKGTIIVEALFVLVKRHVTRLRGRFRRPRGFLWNELTYTRMLYCCY